MKNLTLNSNLLNAVMALVVVLLAGCSKKEPVIFPDPNPALADGAFVSATNPIMIGQTEYEADFGTLTVLENRENPASRFIHLPVVRIHSSATTPLEPIFYLSGGPGISNMSQLENMWYLLPEHDVVYVGYRGVDGSSILDCPEVSDAIKGTGELFSEDSLENIGKAWEVAAKRLTDQGVDLDGYTMMDVIEDHELARKALGYDRINLKSGSYGTRVAYLYGLKYPNSIHRSVQSAVNPHGHFVWDPEVTDKLLHRLSELWAEDPEMAAKTDDVYGVMKSVLDDMPKRWLFMPIDEDKVRAVTFCLLWDRGSIPKVLDAYLAAYNGDSSGLALMSLSYDFVVPNIFNWGDLASKAVSADFDPTRDYVSEMEPEHLPLGAPMSTLLWAPLKDNTWPIKPIPQEYRKVQYSDTPTLLLSGSIDIGTPAEFATNELLPCLRNGQQIILAETTHFDIEWADPENAQRIVSSYFKTGLADLTLNRIVPLELEPGWGFPRIMKIALAAIATLLVVGPLVIYVIFRFTRNKLRATLKRLIK